MSLFERISKNAKWEGNENSRIGPTWKNEYEKWLKFLDEKGQFEKFEPRLKSRPQQRDEAFAEIGPAYYIEKHLGCPIVDWEPVGANGKVLEYSLRTMENDIVYCEVKSPGWEGEAVGEVVEKKGKEIPRNKLPKFINGEVRRMDSYEKIRQTIENKAYPKFYPDKKNLLIINDDLFVSPLDWPGLVENTFSDDNPCINNDDYPNLGGILFFKVELPSQIEYFAKLVRNPKAQTNCKIPESFKVIDPS